MSDNIIINHSQDDHDQKSDVPRIVLGKFTGTPVVDLPDKYLAWCMKNLRVFRDTPTLEAALRAEQSRRRRKLEMSHPPSWLRHR